MMYTTSKISLSEKVMARFLNSPRYESLLEGKYSLTFQPLLYQYAGTPIETDIVDDLAYCHPLNFEIAYKEFRRKLDRDQQVWVVPPGKVTDFSSQPKIVDFIIPRETIRIPALLHDDQRPKISTNSNFSSDGFFCDAIQVWAKQCKTKRVGRFKAVLAFLGVWYGYCRKMKFGADDGTIQEARKRWARAHDIALQRVRFNKEYSEINVTPLP